ncbi:MAG: DUF2802 domain-containing protein [Gammaproteobacteria bacterium]|nr:MAG: DUF2802 domain-containing protein [Gammaproteobacteria bacterium]RKZ95878.1 MAG: DUF2802 domain-containing protein [Gammaproteobacteria bacterium]RKZ97503.1 MAG: DUF2802 domain-containing protein [Gammaproteobacteria bacterium]HHA18666.1 DUF2802 domain-containing protein [Methylophaga sp.]
MFMTTLFIAIGSLLLTLIIAHASFRLFKLNQQHTQKIADLQNQLSALCAGAVGTDDRIIQFEQTLTQIKEYQNTLDLGMSPQHGYDHAIRLARKGVAVNQLIDNCNLSDEEAHLINRMHGNDQQTVNQDLH